MLYLNSKLVITIDVNAIPHSLCTRVDIVEPFGDTNVERKRVTYDFTLTTLTSACPISAFGARKIDVIRTAFTFYVLVTKGTNLKCLMSACVYALRD